MEHALAALGVALDALPHAAHLAGGLGDVVAEDVGVAADELGFDLGGHAAQVAGLLLFEQAAEKVDLEQHVAELVVLVVEALLP